jgi:NADPH2:quinone reductase
LGPVRKWVLGRLRELETKALAAVASREMVPAVQRFPLARAAEAHTPLDNRATTGKVVLIL